MATYPKLTRPQIARIVNNDEQAIRFFEALINRVMTDTPDDIDVIREELSLTSSESATALINALSAKAELSRIADALELFPAEHKAIQTDEPLPPPIQPKRPKYYGAFSDSTTQNAAVINTAYAVTFNTTDLSYGVEIGSPTSRIVVHEPGVYNFQFSAQMHNTSGGVGLAYIWARLNGTTDVPNSAGKIRVKDNNSESVVSWNYVLQMNAGDFFELMWSVDNTAVKILAEAASSPHPGVPSVILTVTDNIS